MRSPRRSLLLPPPSLSLVLSSETRICRRARPRFGDDNNRAKERRSRRSRTRIPGHWRGLVYYAWYYSSRRSQLRRRRPTFPTVPYATRACNAARIRFPFAAETPRPSRCVSHYVKRETRHARARALGSARLAGTTTRVFFSFALPGPRFPPPASPLRKWPSSRAPSRRLIPPVSILISTTRQREIRRK